VDDGSLCRTLSERLKQEGLQVQTVTGEFDASEWVERLAEVEARSPKLRRGQALFDSSARGRFHRAMLHAFARQGRLILVSLSSGSKLCAFAFGLRHNDTAYGYGTAYDSRHKAAAPGVVALRAFVASCFDTGCQKVSLGRGHSHAKHRLAGEQRTLHTLLHFRRPLARHAARMLLVARDRWRSLVSRGGHSAWKRG
jgi:CelD/BcsL family acetyltransferase involved in cellulose biosynthesis